MATRQSKTLWIAALLVAAAIGLIVWILPGPDADEAPPAATADAEQPPAQPPSAEMRVGHAGAAAPKLAVPTPATPHPPPAPAPVPDRPTVDLFAGEMPDFMADLHARVLEKKWLGAPQQKQLYDYGKQHKDDARPQLLLAYDARNREWDGIATQMYAIAYRADPRAKDDPNMLSDLLAIASMHEHDRVEGKDTLEIIQKAYGTDALPEIDREITKLNASGQTGRAQRLVQLREALGR